MSDYEYPHSDIVGQEVLVMDERFKSNESQFDGVVVAPSFQSDKVFVHLYLIGEVVPFERAMVRSESESPQIPAIYVDLDPLKEEMAQLRTEMASIKKEQASARGQLQEILDSIGCIGRILTSSWRSR